MDSSNTSNSGGSNSSADPVAHGNSSSADSQWPDFRKTATILFRIPNSAGGGVAKTFLLREIGPDVFRAAYAEILPTFQRCTGFHYRGVDGQRTRLAFDAPYDWTTFRDWLDKKGGASLYPVSPLRDPFMGADPDVAALLGARRPAAATAAAADTTNAVNWGKRIGYSALAFLLGRIFINDLFFWPLLCGVLGLFGVAAVLGISVGKLQKKARRRLVAWLDGPSAARAVRDQRWNSVFAGGPADAAAATVAASEKKHCASPAAMAEKQQPAQPKESKYAGDARDLHKSLRLKHHTVPDVVELFEKHRGDKWAVIDAIAKRNLDGDSCSANDKK